MSAAVWPTSSLSGREGQFLAVDLDFGVPVDVRASRRLLAEEVLDDDFVALDVTCIGK